MVALDRIVVVKEEPDSINCVRVYCDGVFDLFHCGHARALEQARLFFPNRTRLIVGICADEDVARAKGALRPILSMAERIESLRHCRWVDEIVPNSPWILSETFLEEHRIAYVAHDPEPYPHVFKDGRGRVDDVYAAVKASGQFLPIERTPGISTTDLILRCQCLCKEAGKENNRNGHNQE